MEGRSDVAICAHWIALMNRKASGIKRIASNYWTEEEGQNSLLRQVGMEGIGTKLQPTYLEESGLNVNNDGIII